MPRPSPAEFSLRAVALVQADKPITTAAVQLGVSAAALHKWVRQDQIDRVERPGITTPETAELSKAKHTSSASTLAQWMLQWAMSEIQN